MGQKERRNIKEATPSVHSISSSEVSASDVSSDDGSSVHERSTPKIAAIIILGVFIVAILVKIFMATCPKMFDRFFLMSGPKTSNLASNTSENV